MSVINGAYTPTKVSHPSPDNHNIKVYRALLTQSGTNAPVATVLENTLGGTPVWSRTNIGRYVATLANAFPNSKTIVRAIPSLPETNQAWGKFDIYRTNNDTITLNVIEVDLSVPGGTYTDISALASSQWMPIEILVYP
jgi:hypothetical protein